MNQPSPTAASLPALLDASSRPIYAVDARRSIVYANAALAEWLGLAPAQIVGRKVEYHSEATTESGRTRDAAGPLTDLCPPPQALAGASCQGAVGCVARDGRLVHRRAEFVPLNAPPPVAAADNGAGQCGVLVVLASVDMSPDELSTELSAEPTADELHRTIRRFRRSQAAEYGVEQLLGVSPAMQKVRAQIAAAAACRASVLVRGRRGSGRGHVARAIHYHAGESAGRLLPLDCAVVNEESLRRTVESARGATPKALATLLLEDVEALAPSLQTLLLSELTGLPTSVRLIATMGQEPPVRPRDDDASDGRDAVEPRLLAALSTITIDIPPLVERTEDLPLLAQFFLEQANRGSARQVGSVRPDALDLLALHPWPGELDELRSVIAVAHAACRSHEITPADLPAVVHHAAKAAAMPRRTLEPIQLDDLLARIEREIVVQALSQAGHNKSAAAELLGMTRQRLYRRLVQLGLAKEGETQ